MLIFASLAFNDLVNWLLSPTGVPTFSSPFPQHALQVSDECLMSSDRHARLVSTQLGYEPCTGAVFSKLGKSPCPVIKIQADTWSKRAFSVLAIDPGNQSRDIRSVVNNTTTTQTFMIIAVWAMRPWYVWHPWTIKSLNRLISQRTHSKLKYGNQLWPHFSPVAGYNMSHHHHPWLEYSPNRQRIQDFFRSTRRIWSGMQNSQSEKLAFGTC